MQSPTLLLLLLSTFASALPAPQSANAAPSFFPLLSSLSALHNLNIELSPSTDVSTTISIDSITPPASSLQPVPSGLKLQYAAIGLGTQNYTCSSSSSPSAASTATPGGARATLYDATSLLRASISARVQISENIAQTATCLTDGRDTAGTLPVIGSHYFTSAGTPTFDLSSVGKFLSAKKAGTADAPNTACKGRDGGAAVAWLFLSDSGDGLSKGVKAVYRVNTAGGSPDAENPCDGIKGGWVTRDYAAEYLFYE